MCWKWLRPTQESLFFNFQEFWHHTGYLEIGHGGSISIMKISTCQKSVPSAKSWMLKCLWAHHCYSTFVCAFYYFFFFKYKFIYFNWRLITLQYCSDFAIHWHESATGIHVFPILNPPPTSLPIPSLWSSQCTSPEHPVSCIKPGLVILFTYDNIHVSMPFSQIIPPTPCPTESKRLFYTSALLLSHIQGYHYHLSKFYIYALVYCIGVFLSGLLHSV